MWLSACVDWRTYILILISTGEIFFPVSVVVLVGREVVSVGITPSAAWEEVAWHSRIVVVAPGHC